MDVAECPACGYIISYLVYRLAKYDYVCSRCGRKKLSEYRLKQMFEADPDTEGE